MSDIKDYLKGRNSTKEALLKNQRKVLKKARSNKRKNKKPEKEVEKVVMEWLDNHNFSCHVVESKAVYNASAGRYLKGQTVPGCSDIIGCTPDGVSVWIELKAPGRRSTVSDSQREFLHSKIERGCFAVVVDSVDELQHLYANWCKHKVRNLKPSAKKYLYDSLPKKRKNDAKDDLGLGF